MTVNFERKYGMTAMYPQEVFIWPISDLCSLLCFYAFLGTVDFCLKSNQKGHISEEILKGN